MRHPLVSVIIPAYNSGTHLGETLESVLGQTHRDLQILVVDDGTPDDRVRRIAQRYPTVRYLWQPNAGANTARTTGLRATVGDSVAFLDHDDVWRPEKLEIQLQVAGRHRRAGSSHATATSSTARGFSCPACCMGGPLAKWTPRPRVRSPATTTASCLP